MKPFAEHANRLRLKSCCQQRPQPNPHYSRTKQRARDLIEKIYALDRKRDAQRKEN